MTDPTQIIEPGTGLPHEHIAALRAARDETLEVFGKLIGVGSKGRMSEIERGLRLPTPEQALEIERLSAGMLDAGVLNPVIAAARGAEWGVHHELLVTAETDAVATGQSEDMSGTCARAAGEAA